MTRTSQWKKRQSVSHRAKLPEDGTIERLYVEMIPLAQIAHRFNLKSSSAIINYLKRKKIPPRPRLPRMVDGHGNGWKGDKAGYKALHLRVNKVFGKPRKCEVCGITKGKRFHWANTNGDYTRVENFKRMCVRCHRQYDGVLSGEDAPRAKLNWKQVRRIRSLWSGGKHTQGEIGRRFGVCDATVSQIVTMKSWNKGDRP